MQRAWTSSDRHGACQCKRASLISSLGIAEDRPRGEAVIFKSSSEGETVEFEVVMGAKGPSAEHVT